MAQLLDLTAKVIPSRVLGDWLAGREGAAQRAGLADEGVKAASQTPRTGLTSSDLAEVLGLTGVSSSGMPVSSETALRVSTVYGCVSLLAGAIATLPLGVFERQGNDRSKADHEYWWLFNEQACEGWTSAAAWEFVVASQILEGDGFAELLRPNIRSTRVIGWKPLHPRNVQPFEDTDGEVRYRVFEKGGVRVLDSADILHFPSLGFDGLTSPSPITYAAREAVGTALAAERWAGQFFSGGATFDYALKTASKLDTPQIEALKTSLAARLSGNKRAPLILTGGLEPAQLTVNPKDAEILATRMFSVEEICRILGVPPHMVGHTDKTTSWGSGIEAQGIGFVRYTLMRRLVPIAQELNRKLWPRRERFFVEHITAALERGDLKSRYEAYRIALGRAGEQGWTSPDEIRRLENMAPGFEQQPPADPQPNQGAGNAVASHQAAG